MNVILALLLLTGAQEGSLPDIGYENAFPNLKFERCVGIAHAGDGTDRLYIMEQWGKIFWVENRRDAKEKHLLLDISKITRRRGNEEGLLGIAFHPKFRTNGIVVLQYTIPKNPKRQDRRNILSRFRFNKERTRILPESEEVIWRIPQPYENHNGGVIQFGPDGYLYLGLGDGGLANDPLGNGQNMESILAKFLRIDVDRKGKYRNYGIPKDNPFVKADFPARPEIWSYGWRNPWGFHFDRKTGELWSGDVGQNKWEEICIVRKGGNFGWNLREAFHPFTDGKPSIEGKPLTPWIDPIVEHDHTEAKSITGGVVYRGKRLKQLDGVYLYGDFVTGIMWGLRWNGKKVTAHKRLFEHPGKQIAIFGEDRDGDVYWSSFDGKIYRFTVKP